ncbi:hypothetical protein [Bythopirellula polymerisocia]|uniref:PEP-CTERM protein-sorting domain-containing protein n=1 Tax=Bythopirellula polymerisocia TaxID=2528003 RepID=A0A5C6CDT0_9BACT|nr:hypothetical protein [Bythopirellula polymerisocia]TWU22750.1 hypothetical protein Pla144_42110 [Bythopirellula polymerisocia]
MKSKYLSVASCIVCFAISHSIAFAVIYNVPPDPLPVTFVSGDILNYDPGVDLFPTLSAPAGTIVNLFSGTISGFESNVEGTLNVLGGSVSTPVFARDTVITLGSGGLLSDLVIQRTTLQIIGGRVGTELASLDSNINLLDGEITLLGNMSGSTLKMSGGIINVSFIPIEGGTINMSGGVMGDIAISNGVEFNLSGGTVGFGPSMSFFTALPGSSMHLFVQEAQFNGVDIPGLSLGTTIPFDVTNLLGKLTGVLSDGLPFLFDLTTMNQTSDLPRDPTIVTDPNLGSLPLTKIKILITLVPEPHSIYLAAIVVVFMFHSRSRVL